MRPSTGSHISGWDAPPRGSQTVAATGSLSPATSERYLSPRDGMLEAVVDSLLRHPPVLDAMAAAGQNPLAEYRVQTAVVRACEDLHPALAQRVSAEVAGWCWEPSRRARVAEILAQYVAQQQRETIQVEQAPIPVRLLAVALSVASLAAAATRLFDVREALESPVVYVVAAYQAVFATQGVMFEVSPAWLALVERGTGIPLSSGQDALLDSARFLSFAAGRGLFYAFQGSLWIALGDLPLLGILLTALGIAYVVTHIRQLGGGQQEQSKVPMRETYNRMAPAAVSPRAGL